MALDLALGFRAVVVFFLACVPAPVAFLAVLAVDFLDAPLVGAVVAGMGAVLVPPGGATAAAAASGTGGLLG